MKITLFKQMLVFNPFDGMGETIDQNANARNHGHQSASFG
jgi:hypothetical protein